MRKRPFTNLNGWHLLAGAASGLLLFLSFPPAGLYPLAWVAAVPVLWLAAREPRKSLLPGYVAGAIFFLAGLEWIRHATIAGMVLLGLFLGLYVAAFAFAAGLLRTRLRVPLAIAAPAVWVALEAVRSNVMTGFPYLLLGHSQINILPLMQILDLTGVYGVSFIVMSANGLLAEIILARRSSEPRRFLYPIISAAIVALCVAGSLIYGHHRLATLQTRPGPEVCLVQANIPQDVKNSVSYEQAVDMLVKHLRLTSDGLTAAGYRTGEKPPPLVIWPETAVLCAYNNTRDPWTVEVRGNLNEVLFKELNVKTLLLGVEMIDTAGPEPKRFNSAVCIRGNCNDYQRYDKIHLVPFGEYIPLSSLLFFLKTVVPVGSLPYSHGRDCTLLDYQGQKLGVVICYEDVFPGIVRRFVATGAGCIVNISNEGWFFNSAEADQHLAIARCRAIENRVGLVRATNSGISCLIDPAGRIEKVLERGGRVKMVQGWLAGQVTTGARNALYTRIGDLFAIACIGLSTAMLGIVGVRAWRARPPANRSSKPKQRNRNRR